MKETRQVFLEVDLSQFNFVPHQEGIIRQAKEEDIDQLASLQRYLHHLPKEPPIEEREREQLRTETLTYCLEIDGQIVSTASTNGVINQVFQLLAVTTLPDFQRKGYAKAVCSYLMRHLQATQQAKKAVLFTGYDNIAAQQCYAHLGFQPTKDWYLAEFTP